MAIERGTEPSEAQIAVHWKEEDTIRPPAKFIGQANVSDPAIVERFSEKNFPECFREYADMLHWDQYWHTTLDTSNAPFWKWFVGGKLNACYNCVDRHLAQHKNKAAFIFVPEPEDEPVYAVTYQELFTRVNEVAAVLRDFCGLKAGDRVTIHMPMIPELPITMLACARLGVIHSVVFGGFSGEAAGLRAADSGSRVMIYADGYYRIQQVGAASGRAHLGHVTFLGADLRQRLHAPLERALRPDARPVGGQLRLAARRQELVETARPESRGHGVEQAEGELRVAVGKERLGRRGQPPELDRPAHGPGFFQRRDDGLGLERVEVLAHRHGRDPEMSGQPPRVLRPGALQALDERPPGAAAAPGMGAPLARSLTLLDPARARHRNFLKKIL